MKYFSLILTLLSLFSGAFAQTKDITEDNKNKLAVLWTSGDPEVAEKVCFMYTLNAKKQKWFDEVVLIV